MKKKIEIKQKTARNFTVLTTCVSSSAVVSLSLLSLHPSLLPSLPWSRSLTFHLSVPTWPHLLNPPLRCGPKTRYLFVSSSERGHSPSHLPSILPFPPSLSPSTLISVRSLQPFLYLPPPTPPPPPLSFSPFLYVPRLTHLPSCSSLLLLLLLLLLLP